MGENAVKDGGSATTTNTEGIQFRDIPKLSENAVVGKRWIAAIKSRLTSGNNKPGSKPNPAADLNFMATMDTAAIRRESEVANPVDTKPTPLVAENPLATGAVDAAIPAIDEQSHMDTSGDHGALAQIHQVDNAALKEQYATPSKPVVIEAASPSLPTEGAAPTVEQSNPSVKPGENQYTKDATTGSGQFIRPYTGGPVPGMPPSPEIPNAEAQTPQTETSTAASQPVVEQPASSFNPGENQYAKNKTAGPGQYIPPYIGGPISGMPTQETSAPAVQTPESSPRELTAMEALQSALAREGDTRFISPQEVAAANPASDNSQETPLRPATDQQSAFLDADAVNARAWNDRVQLNADRAPHVPDAIFNALKPTPETPPPPQAAEPIEGQVDVISTTRVPTEAERVADWKAASIKANGQINPGTGTFDPKFDLDSRIAQREQMIQRHESMAEEDRVLAAKQAEQARIQEAMKIPLSRDQIKESTHILGEDPPDPSIAAAGEDARDIVRKGMEADRARMVQENETDAAAVAARKAAETPTPGLNSADSLPAAPKTLEEFKAEDPEYVPTLEAAAERAKDTIRAREAQMKKNRSFADRVRGRKPKLSQAERQAVHDEEQQAAYAEIVKAPNAAELAAVYPPVAAALETATQTPVVETQTPSASPTEAPLSTPVAVEATPIVVPSAETPTPPAAESAATPPEASVTASPETSQKPETGTETGTIAKLKETYMNSAEIKALTTEKQAVLNALFDFAISETGSTSAEDLANKIAAEKDPEKKKKMSLLLTILKAIAAVGLAAVAAPVIAGAGVIAAPVVLANAANN